MHGGNTNVKSVIIKLQANNSVTSRPTGRNVLQSLQE
jgi:hypothetical protein